MTKGLLTIIILVLLVGLAVVLFVVFRTGNPATNTPSTTNSYSSINTSSNSGLSTNQTIDTNDNLDEALEELETVEE